MALHGPEHGGVSEGPLLRPEMRYPKWCYYCAVALNAVARCGWAIYISPDQTVLAAHMVLVLGCVELLRRSVWALLRLEWEDIHTSTMSGTGSDLRPGASGIGGSDASPQDVDKDLSRPLAQATIGDGTSNQDIKRFTLTDTPVSAQYSHMDSGPLV